MNERIRQIAEQTWPGLTDGWWNSQNGTVSGIDKFSQLIVANLAEELHTVAQGSKKANPEWANGVDHAAMLAQRMTMELPQWPEAE